MDHQNSWQIISCHLTNPLLPDLLALLQIACFFPTNQPFKTLREHLWDFVSSTCGQNNTKHGVQILNHSGWTFPLLHI